MAQQLREPIGVLEEDLSLIISSLLLIIQLPRTPASEGAISRPQDVHTLTQRIKNKYFLKGWWV